MVAAWMSADTGVGPSMASASQGNRGIWADLPITPTSSSRQMAVMSAEPILSRLAKMVVVVERVDPVEDEEDGQQEADVADPVVDERLLARHWPPSPG